MATKKLKRIAIPQGLREKLTRHNIHTCKDVLCRNQLELLKILNTSLFVVEDVIHTTSMAVAVKSVTAFDLWNERGKDSPAFLQTSLPELDKVLHGGLPSGTISEIAGPSGCGKTQFCTMLSVIATLPRAAGGLGGSVLYIDTESAFSAERLVQIAKNRYSNVYSTEESLNEMSRRVHVYNESTCATLLKRLQTLEEDLIEKNVKLVIVDSIASLVRKEFDSRGSRNMIERTNLLAKEAAILKYMAEEFKIPVVVTNQITTRFGTDHQYPEENDKDMNETLGTAHLHSLDGESGYVTAALGNTWSHSVNSRLIVQYLDGGKREVMIAKSPVAPFAAFVYTIQSSGIVLEEGGANHYDGTDPTLQRIRVRSSIPQAAFNY